MAGRLSRWRAQLVRLRGQTSHLSDSAKRTRLAGRMSTVSSAAVCLQTDWMRPDQRAPRLLRSSTFLSLLMMFSEAELPASNATWGALSARGFVLC
jgi:hypothetical protein